MNSAAASPSHSSCTDYNIIGGLSGLGDAIYIELLHHTPDSTTFQQVLLLGSCTAHLPQNSDFDYASTPVLAGKVASVILPTLKPTVRSPFFS